MQKIGSLLFGVLFVAGCYPTVCGDHHIKGQEECDDGNQTDGDGCSSTCQIEEPPSSGCGDGVASPGELCLLIPEGFPTSADGGPLVAKDLNQDDLPDLAVASFTQISVLFAQGQGKFAPPSLFPCPAGDSLLAEDLDNDGLPELISPKSNIGIEFLPNLGAGQFDAPIAIAVSGGLVTISAGDLNGDSNIDLFAATSAGVVFVENQGSDQFLVHPALVGSTPAFASQPVDLDGDGDLDLVVSAQNGLDFFFQSSGQLNLAGHIDGEGTAGMTVDDLDGDSFPEVLVVVSSGVTLYANQGGQLSFGRSLLLFNPTRMTTGDIDQDGLSDLILASGQNELGIFLNQGEAQFAFPLLLSVGSQPLSLVVTDLNQDSAPDLAASVANAANQNVAVILSNP